MTMSRDKRQSDTSEPPPPRLSAKEQHDADYITALAAFFVLALAEQDLVEEHHISSFEKFADEAPYDSMSGWRYWRFGKAEDNISLSTFMQKHVWADLRRGNNPANGPLGLFPDLVGLRG